MSGSASTSARGLACTRCGGTLRAGVDPQRLHCAYCDTHHVYGRDDDVAAFAPAGGIGRRRAQRVVREALDEAAVGGMHITGARRAWLPFWHVRGKLVGWQVYQQAEVRRPVTSDGETPVTPASRTTTRREELVARDVDVTLPGCDARAWGLVGIADRLATLRLRPVAMADEDASSLVCAVVVPRAAAMRHAESLRASGLAPRGATAVRQRVSMTRVRSRLVYYPVWRVDFVADGRPGRAHVDAIRARVVDGDVLRRRRSDAWTWWCAAAGSGWVSGLHPAIGVFALTAWWLHRLREDGPGRRDRDLPGWLDRQLADHRDERIAWGGASATPDSGSRG